MKNSTPHAISTLKRNITMPTPPSCPMRLITTNMVAKNQPQPHDMSTYSLCSFHCVPILIPSLSTQSPSTPSPLHMVEHLAEVCRLIPGGNPRIPTKLPSIREASPKGCESGCLGGWTASQIPRVGFLHPGFWLPDHGNRDLLRSGDIESNPGPLRGSGRGGQGHGGNPVAPVNSPRGGGRGHGGNPVAPVNSLGSCSQCGGDFTRWSRPLSCLTPIHQG